MTTCPLVVDGAHAWTPDPTSSDYGTMRYGCACGARATRKRARKERDGADGWREIPGGEIVECKPGSKADRTRRPGQEPFRAVSYPSAGTNAAGHRLPGGTGGRRR